MSQKNKEKYIKKKKIFTKIGLGTYYELNQLNLVPRLFPLREDAEGKEPGNEVTMNCLASFSMLFLVVTDTPRKRTFPFPPGFQSALENNASSHKIGDISSPSYPSMIGGGHHPAVRDGRSSTSSQSSCESASSFDPSVTPPIFKRSREDLESNEGKFRKVRVVFGEK